MSMAETRDRILLNGIYLRNITRIYRETTELITKYKEVEKEVVEIKSKKNMDYKAFYNLNKIVLMCSGAKETCDNNISICINEIKTYEDRLFFKVVANSILEKIMARSYDLRDMVTSITQEAEQILNNMA
ncbi:MAG: hypothetical protein ACRC0S_05125 [Fusobacteriaceae bacterium]